ncbi:MULTISPECIES: DNA translocase FtsK [Carnobacterium]|uniref:DNA translocase FtsK n=1 Tax=Carnobacterium TaxID=2747 RepID=UPI00288DC415|nr:MULTISPECIES: DNA translocase FtsK [Carnobacterium]MDT1938523.1 DNA translocase FtsK [Carnobacterium divergens]MDT1940961.1 DNA translocase FtsK [Carnobacterium divergens]MDT1946759.1 DNA translocase FtsK [Carnobacterium divergens]MDT1949196.1 DNA translocase FtsK [Carnobacterium divergens]MDT1954374.1 DNA translocase FtsK [Carnobacterium divergens]
MSNYDGPSYQGGQNHPKKFKFPFYSDTEQVRQNEKKQPYETQNNETNRPVKLTKSGRQPAPDAVFSEFLHRTKEYTRKETNAVVKKETQDFHTRKANTERKVETKQAVKHSIEKQPTAYHETRSSTPFKVQKIPSPIYGFQREDVKKTIDEIDYDLLAARLKKELNTFILLTENEDSVEIEVEKDVTPSKLITFEEVLPTSEVENSRLIQEEEYLEETEKSRIPQIEEIHHDKKRGLSRSLAGMIEEEQDITINRGTNVARYFGELHEEEFGDEAQDSDENEGINKEESSVESLLEEATETSPFNQEESDLELKAALSRFNYLSQTLTPVVEEQVEESSLEDSISEEVPPFFEEKRAESVSEELEETIVEEQPQAVEEPSTEEPEAFIAEEGPPLIEETRIEPALKDNPVSLEEKVAVSVLNQIEDENLAAYQFPSLSLLEPPVQFTNSAVDDWVIEQAEMLNEALDAFGVDAQVIGWTIGPAVTQFELQLGRGVKVNKITNLSDDLKLALAAKDIRIEAPIPGRSSVGVEIPNQFSRPVMISEVMESPEFKENKSPLTVAIGVNLSGKAVVSTIDKMPHGLIAGATGSGKSVFINSILISLLYKANPSEVKLILIDPKAVELAPYNDIPHLLSPVISEPKAAAEALKWAVEEMEERYQKLAAAGVRNIEKFNEKAALHGDHGLKIPYIVIVIDELADLMMVASSEVQDYIARITQKARAAGIHLLVATQRPSVDVVTGTIKNNIPTRVAFMVSSQVDSRTIMDTGGAEKLLGKGDMLFLENGIGQPIRVQGTYVENEIDSIVQHVKDQRAANYLFEPETLLAKLELVESQDELFDEILAFISEEDTVSVSLLQRKFKIGFNRASNLIEALEEQQLISGNKGSKPRDVFLTKATYEANYQKTE